MAARFRLVDSESSEEEDEEESNEEKRVEHRRQWFDDSSEEEDDTRKVRTQKEKKWEILSTHCAKIKSKLKIQDYVEISNEFDELNKQLTKSESLIQTEGVPIFYIRTLVRIDEAVNSLNKESQKKLSTNNYKSYSKLKVHLKKIKPTYEEQMQKFKENPVKSEESSDYESEEEVVKTKGKAKGKDGKKKKPESEEEEEEDKEDEDDESGEEESDEWGEGSDDDESSDVDDRPLDPQNRRAFWTLKEDAKDETERKKDDRPRKTKEKKEETKEIKEEQKKEIFTTEIINAKLKEIIEKRTKKVSNYETIIIELQNLLSHCKDSELSLQILHLLVLFEFENSKDTITVVMPRPIWLRLIDYITRITDLYSPKLPIPTNLDETRKAIITSLSMRLDRLSKELTKAFKYLDAKSPEYSHRLLDTISLSKLINKVTNFYKQISDHQNLATLAVLSIYQIHYLHDDILAEMRLKSKDKSSDLYFSVEESEKYLEELAQLVYTYGEPQEKVFTALMVSYHHALHGRYQKAKDLYLKANPAAFHSDLTIQVFTNRVIVQIGLSAFYNGNVQAAFKSLNEIVSTHRLKELLAQSFSLNKDKSSVQDERKRAIPYHMHINTEVIETVYFICAMITDIPKMAMNPQDPEKFTLSRYFKKLMDFHERQASSGLTEGFREFIIVATQKLRRGYWREAYEVLEALDTWKHVPRQAHTKALLLENLKQAGMVTYLLTYGDFYQSFSKKQLSEKFEIEVKAVEKCLNPLILTGEINAYWDGDNLNLRLPGVVKIENNNAEKIREKATNADMSEKLADFNAFLADGGKKTYVARKKKQLKKIS